MRYTDIAIIGGGLAGSTAAAMLGRAGISSLLIDPHAVYPFDFRVEKLSGDEQLARFFQTGIAESVLRSATHDAEIRPSLLLVVLILVVVFIVVVGLTGRAMRVAALVVPELAIGAVGGQQLGV